MKEIEKINKDITVTEHEQKCKKSVKHLNSKLKKLQTLGITHIINPVNVPEGVTVSLNKAVTEGPVKDIEESGGDFCYETVDSDIDIRVELSPKQKNRLKQKKVSDEGAKNKKRKASNAPLKRGDTMVVTKGKSPSAKQTIKNVQAKKRTRNSTIKKQKNVNN